MPQHHMVRSMTLAVAVLVLTVAVSSPVQAHSGGTPRLTNSAAGPYRVYAWTDPEPLRVGEVHVSVIVTEHVAGNAQQPERPVTDAAVQVEFQSGSTNLVEMADQQTFLNELYYEVVSDLPIEGEWQFNVVVSGPRGSGKTGFNAEVLPRRAINWVLVGAGSGIVLLLLFAMRIWSRMQNTSPPSRPSTRVRRYQA